MKLNFEMDKRMTVGISAAAVLGVVFFFVLNPLWSKTSRVSQEARILNDELSRVRVMLKKNKDFNQSRHPISRGEVSLAINEIMELGVSLDIDFFATNPQKIQKKPDSKYLVLPIRMELQSTFENFGTFLGSIENLSESIVTVKQFDINRNPMILPDISVELVLEIHLKEGEGG